MSMRDIYRKIAIDKGITVEEVKRDMQIALNAAYKNPMDAKTMCAQQKVTRAGETPTPEEFIAYASDKIADSQHNKLDQ